MKRLTVAHVQQIHSLMITETGGLDGLRDAALLESAVNAPFQTFDGQPLYRSLEAKTARLACSLVNNHAFIDGNKRTGVLAMLLFLELNGVILNCDDEELIHVGLALADGSMNDAALLNWLLDKESEQK